MPTSNKQVMESLALANKIRFERAQIKRDLRSGKLTIAELIMEMPESIKNATVYEMLDAMNRWGRTRTLRLLRSMDIPENKTFGWLSPRQKTLLEEEFS